MQNLIPKKYCYIKEFNLTDLSKLSNNINLIYRNYEKPIDIKEIQKLKTFCKKNKRKLFLSNNIKLALKLRLDGVYIPSFNNLVNYGYMHAKPKKFKIIGSAHNLREVRLKKKQGCSEVFLSSIFKNNKSRKFLGLIKFNLIKLNCKTDFIALGGINQKNFKKLKLLKIKGFASISWSKKNGLSKLRPF